LELIRNDWRRKFRFYSRIYKKAYNH
jgi:hypothetical protein